MARAIITAMESKKEKFDAFNVCTGKTTTVNGLADTVIGLFGATSKVLPPSLPPFSVDRLGRA